MNRSAVAFAVQAADLGPLCGRRRSSLKYVKVVSDENGETRFEEVEVDFELADFAPPAPPANVSAPLESSAAMFVSVEPGWTGDWHPAPARQLACVLQGIGEVEVGDGSVRELHAGDVLLVEDTSGRGHITRAKGNVTFVALFVRLAE